jgi:hypothetical protein
VFQITKNKTERKAILSSVSEVREKERRERKRERILEKSKFKISKSLKENMKNKILRKYKERSTIYIYCIYKRKKIY